MSDAERKVDLAWKLLRLGFTAVPLVVGVDKFAHKLADWDMYLSPTFAGLLPFDASTFLRVAGVVEIAVGLLMLTRWVRFAAYAASAWLLAISINLISSGMFYDVALRDIGLALAAFVLALLTEARTERMASATPRAA